MMENYLTIYFIIMIVSNIYCRYKFYSELKRQNLSSNPWMTKRWISINSVVEFHILNSKLDEDQIDNLKLLAKWETFNFLLLPLFFVITFLLLALGFR